MGKRILVTSTDVMMIQFLVPHVVNLVENGYIVDVGCSSGAGYKEDLFLEKIKRILPKECNCFEIRTERSPYSLKNRKGYQDLKNVINNEHYDLIWTNEPVMGVLTRFAARNTRKKGTKVLYIAHGFHFFKGAPRQNWIYFFIEKVMSYYCDYIATINWEDYTRAKKYLSKNVFHLNGIGANLERFNKDKVSVDYKLKRKELGVDNQDIMMISVGELLPHKNHETMIRALKTTPNNENIKYFICGKGELQKHLLKVVKELHLEKQVTFLGHRNDIPELLSVADIFAHPSTREGLGVAAIEAMAMGLPLITSNIHGINDYIVNGKNGFCCNPKDVKIFSKYLYILSQDANLRKKMGKENIKISEKYSLENSKTEVVEMIKKIMVGDNNE